MPKDHPRTAAPLLLPHDLTLVPSWHLLIVNNTSCSHVLTYLVHCLSSLLLYILEQFHRAGAISVLFSDFAPEARLVPDT